MFLPNSAIALSLLLFFISEFREKVVRFPNLLSVFIISSKESHP